MSDTRMLDEKEAAALLLRQDDILIIAHRNPDGDALGCGYALWAGLRQLGKMTRLVCSSEIPEMYRYLSERHDGEAPDFDPAFVVAVDTATPELMGKLRATYADKTDLCIDHHGSNARYAKNTLLKADYASCAEVVYELLLAMGATVDEYIASALYTGISTDTGCYLYRNTTARCHEATARLIDCGIDLAFLNKILFETKTRAQLALERLALDTLDFYYHDKIAVITVTPDMMELSGAKDDDMTSITPLPRKIEGVEAGVTFRVLKNGNIKCSLRTTDLDASAIAATFGGGGHSGAAGFECSGELLDVKMLLVRAIIRALEYREMQA